MIGVFHNHVRIGSVMHFSKLAKPCWVGYALNGKRQSFKTRKEAVDWLASEYQPELAR